MGRQPQWDIYEAIILVDEYQKVKEKRIDRNEAIKRVSNVLRERQLKKGIEIGETFRNENGIRMRFGELDCIYSDGEKGLKNTSKLFREVVELYQTDREKCLMMIEETNPLEEEILYEQFAEWLLKKSKKNKTSDIISNLRKIEKHANRAC